LVEALTLLIPTANLLLPVQRTVRSALEIANATSLENALYQFYLAERGAPSDDDTRIEIADEEQTGSVLLCTFPGLRRLRKDDEDMSYVYILKAKVELESAFIPDSDI
jgi:hypothetical protein